MKNLPLALLLFPTASVQAQIRVCGSTYSDASLNCTINPTCPTGDGCPPEKDTCFNLPEDQCLSPPTAAPIVEPVQVCALDYESAKLSCDRSCEAGCNSMEACFSVFPDDCVVGGVPELVSDDPESEAVAIMEDPTDVKVCGLSFADAAENCYVNTTCNPTSNECATGQACFVVPIANCTVAESGSTDVLSMNSTDPSLTAVETTTPAPTMPPVEPTHIFVCGEDYGDAETNCNTNNECPSGDGCLDGKTCFAVPFANCRPAPATTVAATTTGAATTMVDSVTTAAANATVPVDVTAVAAITTEAAGEPNLFFCGEDYESANLNCFTAVPCPAGGGCPAGQACFGIPSECKSPEPTLSPSEMLGNAATNLTLENTVTASPTDGTPALRTTEPSLSPVTNASMTDAPTEAPIVNTHFCGVNYTDALAMVSVISEDSIVLIYFLTYSFPVWIGQGMSRRIRMPEWSNCKYIQSLPTQESSVNVDLTVYRLYFTQCFTGITCEATASVEGTPVASPGASTSPTLRGTSSGSPGASSATSSQETVNLDNLLVFRYCGFSPDDARDNCATATPCLDGSDESCPSMQTCFELEEACSVVNTGDTVGDTFPAFTPVTTPVPSVPVTDKPVFDPNVTSFCGVDYDDALENVSESSLNINFSRQKGLSLDLLVLAVLLCHALSWKLQCRM